VTHAHKAFLPKDPQSNCTLSAEDTSLLRVEADRSCRHADIETFGWQLFVRILRVFIFSVLIAHHALAMLSMPAAAGDFTLSSASDRKFQVECTINCVH